MMADAATVAMVSAGIAAVALSINVLRDVLNGGWNMSARITKIEATLEVLGKTIETMSDAMKTIADMRQEHALLEQRYVFMMKDVDDLKRGRGYIQEEKADRSGIAGEYPKPHRS